MYNCVICIRNIKIEHDIIQLVWSERAIYRLLLLTMYTLISGTTYYISFLFFSRLTFISLEIPYGKNHTLYSEHTAGCRFISSKWLELLSV